MANDSIRTTELRSCHFSGGVAEKANPGVSDVHNDDLKNPSSLAPEPYSAPVNGALSLVTFGVCDA